MTKSHESKMLAQVRLWREKAYTADRAKPMPKRTEQAKELARKLNLPIAEPYKTGGCP